MYDLKPSGGDLAWFPRTRGTNRRMLSERAAGRVNRVSNHIISLFYECSMCGINGFNFSKKPLVEEMNKRTRHRGPDDTGVFVNEHVSLGFNRLAIIDLSKNGSQPMFNQNKSLAIIFNGEIYNFKKIKQELIQLGHKFFSETDTEVVLYAYEQWGARCLEKFNGMFAFAIAHTDTGKLFLARDRIGIKPLYFYFKNGEFIFSSEIKSILAHPVSREINKDALNMYFRLLYVPGPLTMFRDIFKLPQASYATVENGTIEIKSYWSLTNFTNISRREEMKERIHALVDESVKMQLVSDRPVGLFLSGGIDSTVVLGAMAQVTTNIKTFSIGFTKTPEEEKYNKDLHLARKTAKHYGTAHEEFIISPKDIQENLERVVYHMDEPVSNPIQAVNMLLAERTVNKATVVLGGDGGDEIFGGYERYYYDQLINRFQEMPKFLQWVGVGVVGQLKRASKEKLKLLPGVDRYLGFWSQKENTIERFLKPEWNSIGVTQKFFQEKYFSKVHKEDFTKQFMLTDLMAWLPDESLLRSDKMGMAASLEQRVPILDHRLVELGFRIPTSEKIKRRGSGKEIFKEAMADYIPSFLLGEEKRGWFSPAAKWVRGDMKPFVSEVLSSGFNAGMKDLFDFDAIQKIFEDHCEKRRYGLNTIWSILVFQLWYKEFMES